MDSLFKRYLWVIHFLILPVGAYLVADMINLVVGSQLEASVKPLDEELSPIYSSTVGKRNYVEIIEGNIFNSSMRGESEVVLDPQIEVDLTPPVDLKITLTGTVVGEGGASYAIIEHQTRREQLLYRLGELIDNHAKIVKIDRDEVTLMIGNTQKQLRLYLEEGPEIGAKGMSSARTDQNGVVKVTPNQWVLDRQEVTAALDNLPRLLTKARVVPNFSSGKPNGFRVFSIVPNSLFAKIGLQNGDILQRINGIEIKDPENFMRVFQQLKGETSITLDLVRSNQKQTFAYEVR